MKAVSRHDTRTKQHDASSVHDDHIRGRFLDALACTATQRLETAKRQVRDIPLAILESGVSP